MKVKQAKVAGASSSRSRMREQDAPATLIPTLTPKLRFPEFRMRRGGRLNQAMNSSVKSTTVKRLLVSRYSPLRRSMEPFRVMQSITMSR
jgi:hypothetical protein